MLFRLLFLVLLLTLRCVNGDINYLLFGHLCFLQGGIAIGCLWTCYRLANRFFGIYVEDYEEEDHDTQSIRWFDERTGDHGDWEERRKD